MGGRNGFVRVRDPPVPTAACSVPLPGQRRATAAAVPKR